MRSPQRLYPWLQLLMLHATPCQQHAAWDLLRAMLHGFTVQLTQLARQADRPGSTKTARQRFSRFLQRGPAPTVLYARLTRRARRVLLTEPTARLIIDATCLADGWVVLQVSVAWQRRALPLYRAVYPYAGEERNQPQAVAAALRFLRQVLPGPRRRYLLLFDRGFGSATIVRQLQVAGFRYVVRVKSNTYIAHPAHQGQLRTAAAPGPAPRSWTEAAVGWLAPHARDQRPRTHVVAYHGEGCAEPWYLLTSEASAATAVRYYRQRMQIEQEFRDLKGSWGLDQLARWHRAERVARFLAWVAVYEWALARLWLKHQLQEVAVTLQASGPLSWIRITREWLQRQIRLHVVLADVPL